MTLAELGISRGGVLAFAFVWGALWGSFLNVVIHRVPLGESVVHPGSRCPACNAPIRAWDNLPIASWLFLRGRARCCGVAISPRYAVVELLGAVVSTGIAEHVLHGGHAADGVGHMAAVFLAEFALAMALIAAAFIDAEHMYLPDPITIGGTLFGLATPGLRDLGWTDALLGAAAGFFGVWLPFVVGYEALRGRPGMGLGDAKLVMVAGAWFGWQGAAFALFAGAVQASLAAMLILLIRGRIEEPEAVRADRDALTRAAAEGDEEARQALADDPLAVAPDEGILAARLPFGPFLCLATLEWMLAGRSLAAALLGG